MERGRGAEAEGARTIAAQRWIERHRALAFGLYLVATTGFVLGGLELGLRIAIGERPDYYTAFTTGKQGSELQYPYGIIKINHDGFPDDEFPAEKARPRVGYIGDSVTYGVGAGYGYRFTDLEKNLLPGFEHMNLAEVGSGITSDAVNGYLALVQRYHLDTVVYVMNLNDIMPDIPAGTQPGRPPTLLGRLIVALDPLRGRSYLYTTVRSIGAGWLTRLGFRHDGQQAYDLFPQTYEPIVDDTASRIRRFAEVLASRGVRFVVLIVPYEMQISSAAERRYSELGIRWDPGLIERFPQQRVEQDLAGILVVDAYWAFVDAQDVAGSRARNGLGQYFVYDLGGRLDWNHPNREGHRKIADYLAGSGALTTQ